MYWTLGLNATAYQSLTVNGVPQFQAANPAAGVPQGTSFTPAWFNDIQGENINIVLAGGIAPAQNMPTQVLQSLRRIFGGNVTLSGQAAALTADQMGFIEIGGGTTYVTTLPTPVGSLNPPVTIWNNGSAAQTLATPAGNFDGPGGSGETTMTIAPNQVIQLRSDTFNYIVAAQGPTLASLQSVFAALNGSAAEQFAVANATAADQAPAWSQVVGGNNAHPQNVTGSRAIGTVYTNSTPRPLIVSGNANPTVAIDWIKLLVDGNQVYSETGTPSYSALGFFGIVPPGSTYELQWAGSGAGSLGVWWEY